MIAGGFAPKRIRTHIDSTSDQVLKIYVSLIDIIEGLMNQRSHKKCLFKGEGELEIESL